MHQVIKVGVCAWNIIDGLVKIYSIMLASIPKHGQLLAHTLPSIEKAFVLIGLSLCSGTLDIRGSSSLKLLKRNIYAMGNIIRGGDFLAACDTQVRLFSHHD